MMKRRIREVMVKLTLNPSTYKAVYKTKNWLYREVIRPRNLYRLGNYLLLLFGFLTGLFMVSKSMILTTSIPVSIYLFCFLAHFILSLIIRKHLINTGTKARFIFPGTYIVRNFKKKLCTLCSGTVNPDRYEFAGSDKLEIAAELNYKAFRKSAWGTSYEDKLERNSAHIQRNKFCFLLIKDILNPDKHIGYTHVFPVSKDVWDEYMDGKIGDNEFSDLEIVPTIPSTADQKPYGLIIFSVASVGIARGLEKSKSYCHELGDLFEQALVYHVNTLIHNFFTGRNSKEKIPVLLQNESESFYKFFKGWGTTPRISKDGARIFKFDILNVKQIPSKSITRIA